MSFPWIKMTQSKPAGIENITSQEVARNLQAKEEKSNQDKMSIAEVNDVDDIQFEDLEIVKDDDFANDAIAKQFDDEYELSCNRRKCDKSTSFENYCAAPLNYVQSDSEEEEVIDVQDEKNWDTFEHLENEFALVPSRVLRRGKKVGTTQDVRTDTYKLSGKVFNSLNPHSYTEEFCKYKVHYDKRKRPMYKLLGIDEYAWHLIRKLIKDQVIKKVTDIISFDKEAVTIRAVQSWLVQSYKGRRMGSTYPIQCLVKVFKAASMPNDKARIIARQKAQKEVANNERLRAVGLPCLNIITLKEHVLVMSYLAPALSEANIYVYDYERLYEMVKKAMRKLFVDANLVHANLSEHNILWHSCRIYFINLSQSVDSNHENAFNFLFRDCTNIVNFFKRRRFSDGKDPDKLFKYITGYSFCDKCSLLKLQKTIRTNMLKQTKIV